MRVTRSRKPLTMTMDPMEVVGMGERVDGGGRISKSSLEEVEKLDVKPEVVVEVEPVVVDLKPVVVDVAPEALEANQPEPTLPKAKEEDENTGLELVRVAIPCEKRPSVLESKRFRGMTMDRLSASIYKRLEEDIKTGLISYELDRRDLGFWNQFNSRRIKSDQEPMEVLVFRRIMEYLEKNSLAELVKLQAMSQQRAEDLQKEMWDPVCSICGQVEGSPMRQEMLNPMVKCHYCVVSYHALCGTMNLMELGGGGQAKGQMILLCEVCTFLQNRESNINNTQLQDISCVLCPQKDGPYKPTKDGGWAHYTCALWGKETYFSDDHLGYVDGVETIPKARFRLTCSVCKVKSGAPLQCDEQNCRIAYHGSCARKAGFTMMVLDGAYVSLCGNHSIPKNAVDLEGVTLEESTTTGRKRKRPAGFYPLDSATQKFPKLDFTSLNEFAISINPSPDFYVALKEVISYWQTKDEVLHPAYKEAFQAWKTSRNQTLTSASKD